MVRMGLLERDTVGRISGKKHLDLVYRLNSKLLKEKIRKERRKKEKDFFIQARATGVINPKDGSNK